MSIIIACANQREAVLAVDTLGYTVDDPGRKFNTSKSFTLSHLGAVYGASCSAVFALRFGHEIVERGIGSFDELVGRLVDIVDAAYGFGADILAGMGDNAAAHLAVVGWSAARNRPLLLVASNVDEAATIGSFRVREMNDQIVAIPTPQGTIGPAGSRKKVDPDDALVAIAEAQRSMIRNIYGEGGHMGGRLIRHRVTRHEMTTKVIHEWRGDVPERGAVPSALIAKAA
ncbi:MAG: hypothetical protein AB7P02_00030 [Alphaproteobacteria bacterium]